MDDSENTLSFPLPVATQAGGALLVVTVLWHPDQQRAGEQFIGPAGAGEIGLSRFAPLFGRAGAAAVALGHRSVAREAILVRRDGANGLHITPPQSRMALEVNGVGVSEPVYLHGNQVDAGVVLRLGGMILLCLHWMRTLPRTAAAHGLLGVSSGVVALRNAIGQVAGTDLPVLLLGETGTGKEVVAQAIHAASTQGGPLVTVNMATLNESLAAAELFGASKGAYTGALADRAGLFAEAAGGTLFLDEIGNTPPAIQPMLLRVLETGEYRPVGAGRSSQSHARLIAATDQDLDADAPDKVPFNQPLLRRLQGFVIRLPPLRERREDMGLLIIHFARAYAGPGDGSALLPAALVSELCNYDWPGNIRQLANVLRRALIALRADEALSFETLLGLAAPPAAQAAAQASAAPAERTAGARRAVLSGFDDGAVLAAMEHSGWCIRAAALALGVSRPSMYKLLAAHPQIRSAQAIGRDQIEQALQRSGGDLARSAAELKTPAEPLRRHVRQLGLGPPRRP